MTDESTHARSIKPRGPGTGIALVGILVCVGLLVSAATALIDGFAHGSFGRVRHFGVASWSARPVAFVATAVAYLAAGALLARCAIVLLKRTARPN